MGEAVNNAKTLEKAAGTYFGQKPLITKAKKSIAGFRLRRCSDRYSYCGERMYEI